ncbi:MAG: L-threonylcarbamoyladenylate synthase, partial [Deltaproteobacteria bacterium]|nr:L-threonylcarbamoyladenylate synthase [Deltaproteobacteria bacterium]
ASSKELKKWAVGVTARERKLMKAFWPGPLTLVFKARRGLHRELTGGSGKIGIRVSSDKTARALCMLSGGAITSTSANRSGEPPATTARIAGNKLGSQVDGIVISTTKKLKQINSTILDVSNIKLKILREGIIPKEKLIHAKF